MIISSERDYVGVRILEQESPILSPSYIPTLSLNQDTLRPVQRNGEVQPQRSETLIYESDTYSDSRRVMVPNPSKRLVQIPCKIRPQSRVSHRSQSRTKHLLLDSLPLK